jgi:hypothetical protein
MSLQSRVALQAAKNLHVSPAADTGTGGRKALPCQSLASIQRHARLNQVGIPDLVAAFDHCIMGVG